MTRSRSPLFTSARRSPRRRWLSTLKVVLGVTAAVAVLATAVVGAIWAESLLRLGGDDVSAVAGDLAAMGEDGPSAPDGATTLLVTLVEHRDPTDPRPAPLAGPVALVQVTESREQVAVVALPPELEAEVEEEGDLPLAEVQREGGIELLLPTVVRYTGVRVDHVVSASVDALPRLTEALDGTERCSSSGCRVLDADAVRSETVGGDPEEQALAVAETARGLAGQVDGSTPLRHPFRSRAVIGAVAEEVGTDVSLRGRRLLEVAGAIDSSRPLEIAVVPGLVNPDSERLLVPPEEAEALFHALREGSPLEGGELVAEPEELLPDGLTIGVLNGTGTAGLAGRIESQLVGAGFEIAGTDNADFGHEQTVVEFNEADQGAEVAAILIAEQLDGARLEATDAPLILEGDQVDVQVTVGDDLDDGDDA